MSRILTISLALVTVLTSAIPTQERPYTEETPESKTLDKDQEAWLLAQELLTGKSIVVRVYPDWKKDTHDYKLVAVPLNGLDVEFAAIKSAFEQPPMAALKAASPPNSAVIVVMGADQSDEVVKDVLGEYVFAEPYREQPAKPASKPPSAGFSIWPQHFDFRYKWFLFKDAIGNPIPNAAVEIMIARGSNPWKAELFVYIAQAKLGEKGLLLALKSTSCWRNFRFMVSHPDYGPTAKPAGVPFNAEPEDNVMPVVVSSFPMDKWCVFKDALGNPIPNATVEIYEGRSWDSQKQVLRTKVKLDQSGRLEPPTSDILLQHCHFLVSHPNYGTAIVEPGHRRPDELLTSCTVPLVRIGTKADERSIWGIVVDPNGNPVGRAILSCCNVHFPGGGKIDLNWGWEAGWPKCAKVITDPNGRFAMYLPIEATDYKLIPLGAEYGVGIDAPKELGLDPYGGLVPSGQETTITMAPLNPKPEKPTFVFEDEFGQVTEPNMLKKIRIKLVQDDGHWRGFGYDTLVNEEKVHKGTYYATVNWNGKHYEFEPVEVTEETPQTIIFRPKEITAADIIYKGRVINAITSQPIADAIVLRRLPYNIDTSKFKEEQIEAIFNIGPEIVNEISVIEFLQQIQDISKITRTDATGWFQIVLESLNINEYDSLIAVKKDFLGAEQQLKYPVQENGVDTVSPQFKAEPLKEEVFQTDEFGYVVLPPMRLIPAGSVIIDPNIPNPNFSERTKPTLRFQWYPSPDNEPSWLKALSGTPRDNRGASIFYTYKLYANRIQTIYVPAAVELKLKIFETRASALAPAVFSGIKLEQGQVLNLGRIDFQPTLKVAVKVVDSKGKCVEGITVRHLNEHGHYLGRKAVTGEDGVALFYVPPNSKGKFLVARDDRETSFGPKQDTSYQVAGYEEEGKVFILQLTDEMLEYLFNR